MKRGRGEGNGREKNARHEATRLVPFLGAKKNIWRKRHYLFF